MYRETARAKECQNLRNAKERKRMDMPAPEYPLELPKIRRVIEIRDYDFGEKIYCMELRKAGRIDCYDCYIDGELWKAGIGWSRVLEWVRKSLPRVRAWSE